MYFNGNFNGFFKLIKVHLLVSELCVYQNARCNDKKNTALLQSYVIQYKYAGRLVLNGTSA